MANNSRPEATYYDNSFYEGQIAESAESARVVLAELFALFQPCSILDVGCGRGAWLAAAHELGCVELCGIDGDWIAKEDLILDSIDFSKKDLNAPLETSRKFDLAISLEVAEHLPSSRAKSFVFDLCQAADVVLFGAAIDGQGGTNHINEQPQSYWTNLFEEEGYVCIDVLRQSLWNDKRVKWWYVQNTYLYVKYGSEALGLLHKHVGNDTVFDAVHPLNLKHKVNNLKELEERIENPTIQLCLSIIKKYVKNKIARLSL